MPVPSKKNITKLQQPGISIILPEISNLDDWKVKLEKKKEEIELLSGKNKKLLAAITDLEKVHQEANLLDPSEDTIEAEIFKTDIERLKFNISGVLEKYFGADAKVDINSKVETILRESSLRESSIISQLKEKLQLEDRAIKEFRRAFLRLPPSQQDAITIQEFIDESLIEGEFAKLDKKVTEAHEACKSEIEQVGAVPILSQVAAEEAAGVPAALVPEQAAETVPAHESVKPPGRVNASKTPKTPKTPAREDSAAEKPNKASNFFKTLGEDLKKYFGTTKTISAGAAKMIDKKKPSNGILYLIVTKPFEEYKKSVEYYGYTVFSIVPILIKMSVQLVQNVLCRILDTIDVAAKRFFGIDKEAAWPWSQSGKISIKENSPPIQFFKGLVNLVCGVLNSCNHLFLYMTGGRKEQPVQVKQRASRASTTSPLPPTIAVEAPFLASTPEAVSPSTVKSTSVSAAPASDHPQPPPTTTSEAKIKAKEDIMAIKALINTASPGFVSPLTLNSENNSAAATPLKQASAGGIAPLEQFPDPTVPLGVDGGIKTQENDKLKEAFDDAWTKYQNRNSGYRTGIFSGWRHNTISPKKEQLKADFYMAFGLNSTQKMLSLLEERLRDGDFNNGSFNNILINSLQSKGIVKINNFDLNYFRPQDKRVIKEPAGVTLYRFDSRNAEEIAAAGGFTAKQHSDVYDDILNVKSGSIGVSFTTDKQVAIAYMLKRVKDGNTDGALYTVVLDEEEAATAFSLSKTAKARGDSDLWLRLKGGAVTVTEENGKTNKRSKCEVNIVPKQKGGVAVKFKNITEIQSTNEYLQAHHSTTGPGMV